jgi:catechol 2,3-dioxygenase-like lactoylglutathione lyase family enzyme
MVHTYGLTHINLVVRDVARSLRFYGQVFGVEEYGRTDGLVHTRTPGCHDVTSIRQAQVSHAVSRISASVLFRPVTSTRRSTKSSAPGANC